MQDQISLNGPWDLSVAGIKTGKQTIPASYLCRGSVTLSRSFFLRPAPGKRYFLHIAGVCYAGEAVLNGQKLSRLYPYCDNSLEVTQLLEDGENRLQLHIEDLTADYGPTGGWQDYGGIAWGVWLEILPTCYFEDIHVLCDLDESFSVGRVNAEIKLSGEPGLQIRCLLERDGVLLEEKTQEIRENRLEFSFSVKTPALWAPEHPALYTLHAFLFRNGELLHEKSLEFGFRELCIKGNRFYLNGERLLLKGVARHDQWGEQGFFITEQQMEDDIRLLKEAGVNFVRCAHYPVHPLFPVLCNRYGLLISEEPGLWQQDCADPFLSSTAIEIMRRTAIRDRNHPCVAFWILGNECALVPKYLSEARAALLQVDPTRCITFANDRKPHLSKSIFDDTGLDFYTYHAYGSTPYDIFGQSLAELCSLFSGKPLVFTEWGGWLMDKTPSHIHAWFTELLAHMKSGNLCGVIWWQWQDILQYLRGEPGILQGNLEGLVTADRKPRDMYYTLQEFHRRMDRLLMEEQQQTKITFLSPPADSDGTSGSWVPLKIEADGLSQKALWEQLLKEAAAAAPRQDGRSYQGPALPYSLKELSGVSAAIPAGLPVAIKEPLTVEVGLPATALQFFGHVTAENGFPVNTEETPVAEYALYYENGMAERHILFNSRHFCQVSLLSHGRHLDSRACEAYQAAILEVDPDFERYLINGWMLPTRSDLNLTKLTITPLNGAIPLLYGISAKSDNNKT